VDAPTYNPFDPVQIQGHWPILAELRERGPVCELMPGVYYVSHYNEIIAVLRDHHRFAQAGLAAADGEVKPPDRRMLFETDPPEHTPVRRNLGNVLRQSRVRTWYPIVRRLADELVDELAGRTEFDVVQEFSSVLPARVIGELSGLPASMFPQILPFAIDTITLNSASGDASAQARFDAFRSSVRALIRERRNSIQDAPDNGSKADFMSSLLSVAGDDGEPLSDERVLTHLTDDVLVGGVETTAHMLGNTFVQILSTPGLLRRLDADRDLIPNLIEESLRRRGPVQLAFRRATQDVKLGGIDIPVGSTVLLGVSSGNLDERRFTDPDSFDVTRRDAAQHLGFGAGIHLCVGAPLARLEGVCAVDAMLDRLEDLSFARDYRYERVQFFMMYGPRQVRVRAKWRTPTSPHLS
jgi:cytochrome P450